MVMPDCSGFEICLTYSNVSDFCCLIILYSNDCKDLVFDYSGIFLERKKRRFGSSELSLGDSAWFMCGNYGSG